MFAAYMLYELVFWCLGWEEGLANLAHHVLFLGLCAYLLSHLVFIKIAAIALSMEFSTIPLCLHLVLRKLKGWETLSDICAAVFAATFLFFRLGVFGYGYLDLLWSWTFHFDLFSRVPEHGAHFGMLAYSAAFALQLYWSLGIIAQLYSTLCSRRGSTGQKPCSGEGKLA
jgi:hypothetical protein